MIGFLEGPELIIVAVIFMLIFGASALPKLARSLGQARKELQAGFDGSEETDHARVPERRLDRDT